MALTDTLDHCAGQKHEPPRSALSLPLSSSPSNPRRRRRRLHRRSRYRILSSGASTSAVSPPPGSPPPLPSQSYMATSSGSSQSLGTQESRWRNHGDSSSPIPYREGPLEYTPAVLCKCDAKPARFISWSDLNPELRYLKCARARVSCSLRDS